MEVWKDVKGYEGAYQVSNIGRIKSLSRHVNLKYGKRLLTERVLCESLSSNGYICTDLYLRHNRKTLRVHRLVAIAFIPTDASRNFVNHIDGVKTNNNAENLEWVTSSENNKHAYDTGLKSPDNSSSSKLSYKLASEIRCKLNMGLKPSVLAIRYGVSISTISMIKRNKIWNLHIKQ